MYPAGPAVSTRPADGFPRDRSRRFRVCKSLRTLGARLGTRCHGSSERAFPEQEPAFRSNRWIRRLTTSRALARNWQGSRGPDRRAYGGWAWVGASVSPVGCCTAPRSWRQSVSGARAVGDRRRDPWFRLPAEEKAAVAAARRLA